MGVGGSGGDEVPRVGVDVVEVGVVVVVVVGVVHRHLLDAGGDAPHRLDIRLRGCPAPHPSPYALPVPPGPTPRPACPRRPTLPFPSLPLGLLPGPNPWLGRTPAPLPSGPCRGSRPLSPASLPAPLTPVSFPRPCPCPLLCPRPPTARFGALLTFLRPSSGAAARAGVPPVPLPFCCAVSRVSSSAARALACPVCLPSSAAAGLGALPVPLPWLLAACALACPLCLPLGAPPVVSRPSLRAPVAGTLPRPRAVLPLLDHVPGVLLPLQLQQRNARQRTRGRPGATGRGLPLGKASSGGYGLGGLVWV